MTTVARRAQPWLGTLVSIDVVAVPGARRDAAFDAAFAAVARVHRAMSRQDACSDVARFNAAPAGARIDCDPWTSAVLREAARMHASTQGLFDVALGTAAPGSWRVDDARTIEKRDCSVQLDVGGIAKGFAVDRAIAALRAHGIRDALVNAGGDLRAIGRCTWCVDVRDAAGATVAHLDLGAGAVATSAWRAGRTPHHHDALIVPARVEVLAIDRTVTVAAPRCVVADALTKVVALSGDPHHAAVLRARGQAWLQ